MSIIKLDANGCQNCFKCIRECPLKAIEFKDGRTKIIESECVLCGTCVEICPRNAKYIRSNIDNAKELLASGKKVCVSVAPSYTGWYNTRNFSKLSAALKKLGFAVCEETAIGAAQVSLEYEKLLATGQMKNVIATACSSVVMLIEEHFPELIKMLAPVSSPMMAHARLMREAYGDIKVIFIGPCLSKIHEAGDALAGGLVNEVLTFEDLDKWFEEENITLEEEDKEAKGVCEPIARLYPKQEGIIATIKDFHSYTPVSVDGIDRCIELFSTISAEQTGGIFLEANICAGSCIGGPVMRTHRKNIINSAKMLSKDPIIEDKNPAKSASMVFPHPRVFANRKTSEKTPSEAEIRAVLDSIGKTTPDKELNCGSCGYATCRQKAIAVCQGKADVTMCLPYLRERAENMSSTVIANSPNGILTLDRDMNVVDINPKAEKLFGVTKSEIIGQMIPALYGETIFDDVLSEGGVITKNCTGANENIIMEFSVLYLDEHGLFIAFAKDISEEATSKKELSDLRMSTVETAQDVIEKQMRVAQEIASLLGETTAETKVALTKLKKSIKDISGE